MTVPGRENTTSARKNKRKINRRSMLQQTACFIAGSTALAAIPSGIEVLATPNAAIPNPTVTFVSTTENSHWEALPLRGSGWNWDGLDVQVYLESRQPEIAGFGACFNELGWTSLQALSESDRAAVLDEMFTPGKGANFKICRMPVGANDFSRGWYSYNETPEDFSMEHFSIANDLDTLVPFIRSAKKYNPALRIWASPWSPPTWMKTNKFYAEAASRPGQLPNGIRPDQIGQEGQDLFIQEERYFAAYAKYFGKFIDAYRKQGIEISMVMPQNEFNSAQNFPSCTWSPEGLAKFLRHLGPAMDERHVQVFFGTYERGNRQLLDRVMADPNAKRWIKGVGVQWAGKNAIHGVHTQYPELRIYQSEQECGDGKNEWSYTSYCWNLMKHYFMNGTAGYFYWNISLQEDGQSHWGWPQNSLITVATATKRYKYNHDYYLLKHASHFVQPGARRLETDGTFDNLLAFGNPDKSVAVILRNESPRESKVNVNITGAILPLTLPPDSFNTLLLKGEDVAQ